MTVRNLRVIAMIPAGQGTYSEHQLRNYSPSDLDEEGKFKYRIRCPVDGAYYQRRDLFGNEGYVCPRCRSFLIFQEGESSNHDRVI